MTQIEKLKAINKDMRHGDKKELSSLSRVNRGMLSNYLINCHRMVLNPKIVENIIYGYEKFLKIYSK